MSAPSPVAIERLDVAGLAWAQRIVTAHHYRHSPVDARSTPEAWGVRLPGIGRVGCLIVNRPEATRNYPWYGSLSDVAIGKADLSYWQVLNLCRVWLSPDVQPGGQCHRPDLLPGYTDRRGVFRSTLASTAIGQLARRVGAEYLLVRPPVFLEQPYEIRHLMSYCDTRQHRGVIYAAAGFELHRTNDDGLQTWRLSLPALTPKQHTAIAEASAACPRARRFRGKRAGELAQLPLGLGEEAA